MTTTVTVTVPASRYADQDNCLEAAKVDYLRRHPELEEWQVSADWADEEREQIALEVESLGKDDADWETGPVASYVADCGDCLVDVRVQIGQAPDGLWYIRTDDDGGGSDDAPDTAFATRDEAEAAAEAFASERNDALDGEDADDMRRRQLTEAAGSPDPDGEWCVYWSTSLEDDGPRARYATQEAAEAAAELAQAELERRHPGGRMLCGYEVRCLVDGQWVTEEVL